MGLVIVNHPGFIRRWATRVMEIRGKYGKTTAEKWAGQMFDKSAIELINKELEKRSGTKSNGDPGQA